MTVHQDRELGNAPLAQPERPKCEAEVEVKHAVEAEALVEQPHLAQPAPGEGQAVTVDGVDLNRFGVGELSQVVAPRPPPPDRPGCRIPERG